MNTRHSTRLGFELLEDRTTPTVSTLGGAGWTSVPAGDTLWFTAAGQVSNLGSGATLHVTGGTISFVASGHSYSLTVPNATISLTQLAVTATTTYTAAGEWLVTAPTRFNGEVFLGGAALPVPSGLGRIHNVSWKANFTADAVGPRVRWDWSAAAYKNFGSLDQLGVKTVDDRRYDAFHNSDSAGTPENFKSAWDIRANGFWGNAFSYQSATVRPNLAPPPATGSLSGTVFQDTDGSMDISGGDTGLGGIEVDLFDANNNLIGTTTTATDGSYSFGQLDPGVYSVLVNVNNDPTANLVPSQVGSLGGTQDPTLAGTDAINVTAGAQGTGYNMGMWFGGGT